MLTSRGVDIKTVREAIAMEDTHSGAPAGTSGALIVERHPVEVQIVPETGKPMQVQWEKRIPAVGQILSIDQDQGKSIVYQIVRVEWSITAISIWPPHLAKVLLHARELREKAGDDLRSI